jgi:hypothetical protein
MIIPESHGTKEIRAFPAFAASSTSLVSAVLRFYDSQSREIVSAIHLIFELTARHFFAIAISFGCCHNPRVRKRPP